MDSSRSVNPAPALYAAAIAVVAFGIVFTHSMEWVSLDLPDFNVPDVAWLTFFIGVAAASAAVAMSTDSFGTAVAFAAITATSIAFDVAWFFVGLAIYDGVFFGLIPNIFSIIFGLIFVIITGIAYASTMTICRKWFSYTNPVWAAVSGIIVAFLIITGVVAIQSGMFQYVAISSHASASAGLVVIMAFFLGAIVFFVVVPCRKLCHAIGIDRVISIIAICVTIVATVVSVGVAVISLSDAIDAFGIIPAVAAMGWNTVQCAIIVGLASVVVWWYRALRRR